jgi:hypothetical protein
MNRAIYNDPFLHNAYLFYPSFLSKLREFSGTWIALFIWIFWQIFLSLKKISFAAMCDIVDVDGI